MLRTKDKYGSSVGPLILMALLFLNPPIYSQNRYKNENDAIQVPSKLLFSFGSNKSFILNDSVMNKRQKLVPRTGFLNSPNSEFYDSLKVIASKHLVTRKLYDFVVVTAQPSVNLNTSEPTELAFKKYSGKKISKIIVQRLNVFGTDINKPQEVNANKVENILNKTHLNTNEFIIRKNLLFSEGDTVTPLILSDNERLLRQLPFISDSRIIVVPVSDSDVNIVVLTKDLYSLGASVDIQAMKKGSVSVFDKNILGLGHEFKFDIPFNPDLPNSPGFGLDYTIDNIRKSFLNMELFYYYGLGEKTYGFNLERPLISSTTKYAGGISIREMFTTEDLDTLPKPEPLKYNLQNYWVQRSFLISREPVGRIIIGARYTNNNVFDHPFILPDSYHYLQQYKMFLGSLSFSIRNYYKTSLLYAYGRTEDIPYGGLISLTAGREINEFKKRNYLGVNLAVGESVSRVGYFYTSAGLSSFFNGKKTEEGMFLFRANYFSNLVYLGNYKIRTFIKMDYTRGFDRYSDEYLTFSKDNGFTGFRNDSIAGGQRLSANIESVFFSPGNFYGFRFAYFAFAGLGYLFGTNQILTNGVLLSGIGIGIRIRNDNLLFNTIQIRLAFYPNLPPYSKVNYLLLSGEQLLKPDNFDPGPPSILQYK